MHREPVTYMLHRVCTSYTQAHETNADIGIVQEILEFRMLAD